MCLIVRTQRDIPLTDDVLRDMHKRNPDGYGFAWVAGGKLKIEKNHVNDVEAFIDLYHRTKEYEPVFHLRMRTHGDIDTANTHPYEANHGFWVMHNGVIHFTSQEEDQTKSDTWHFINQFLNPMLDQFSNPHDAVRTLPVRMALGGLVGSNRLVLSDHYGHIPINTPLWHQCHNKHFKGLWVSNTYAWSGDQYKTPEEREIAAAHVVKQGITGYTGYASNFDQEEYDNPGSTPPPHLLSGPDPKFTHIKKNLYADQKDLVWKWTGHGFRRKAKFDTVWSNMKATRSSATSTVPTATSSKSQGQLSLVVSQPTGPTQPAVPALCQPHPSNPKAPGEVKVITPEAYRLLLNQTDAGDEVSEVVTVEIGTPKETSSLVDDAGQIIGTNQPTEEEYTEILVRDWQKAGRHALNGMVYTDPDAASRVLEFVLPRIHV